MATANTNSLKLSVKSQKLLLAHCNRIMEKHRANTELRTKFEAIDVAYARFRGGNTEEGNKPCGDALDKDKIVAPIVISQVDSYVSYLAEVFLSGSPIFPVVSTPANMKYAEQLETLIDDHATLGGYARQLLMFLRNGVKYNICAVEADWDSLSSFNIVNSYLDATGRKTENKEECITKVRNLDMYNTFWDEAVAPGDVSAEGDYAGYVEELSKTKIYRILQRLKKQQQVYNMSEALSPNTQPATNNFFVRPQISDYTSPQTRNAMDWDDWFEPGQQRKIRGSRVEMATFYLRIVPADYGIITAGRDELQIWQVRVINAEVLISAKRILSAYDHLPILFGQPLEDGMDYQTQSVAEMQVDIQRAATTMFGVRFNAARRAVSDRALYDAEMISPKDVNSKSPAAKIPVRTNPLAKRTIEQSYRQIPFDLRGTESAFQDVAALVDFSKQLSGLNSPRQGQFQRGNKSVQEWQDTMSGSDGRLRLAALCLEHQVFVWLKFILVLNIYQYGNNATVVSQRTGETLEIDIAVLREKVLSFRVADGYAPKSKLASTDVIVQGMQMLMQSPLLQQAYGPMLPNMFAHFMQLGGVRGLEQYAPETQTQTAEAPPTDAAGAVVPPEASM